MFAAICPAELAVGQARIARGVLGNGGTEATSAAYHISGTIGQPLIGVARSAGNQEYLGFWYSAVNIPVAVEEISGHRIQKTCSIDAVFPNPVRDIVSIRYSIPEPARVHLTLSDILGRELASLASGDHGPGAYHLDLLTDGLPSGTYVLKLSSGGQAASRRITLLK